LRSHQPIPLSSRSKRTPPCRVQDCPVRAGLGPRRLTERGWGPVPQPGGQQTELFAERGYGGAGPAVALIRDGNGTRSFETLLRYRGAAMAEFWRALRTLKALQAERAVAPEMSAGGHSAAERTAPTAAARIAPRPMRDHAASRRKPDESRQQAQPDEPKRAAARRLAYLPSEPDAGGRTLHEPAATWLTNGPETGAQLAPASAVRSNPKPHPQLEPRRRGALGSYQLVAVICLSSFFGA
jgi:hypothetical protein